MKNIYLSLLVSLFLLGFRQISIAQSTPEVDSLLQDLAKAEEDTNKVRTYFKLYGLVSYSDPIQAKKYIDEAYELATKLGDKRGIILCYDKWGGIEMMDAEFRKAIHYYSIADSLLQDMNWPREKAVIYGNYAGIYKDIGLYDSALYWNAKFIDIANEIKNKMFLGYGYGITGDLYQIKGQFNLAAKHHMKALRLYEEVQDTSRMGDAFLKLGEAHLYGDRYQDAEDNLMKAVEIYKDVNDLYYLKEAYNDLAYLSYQQEAYDQAQEWYFKCDSLSKQLEDRYGMAQALEGYETIAYAKEQYELSLSFNQQALKFYTQMEDRNNISWRNAESSKIFFNLKQYNNALKANKTAENQFTELDSPAGLKLVYQNYYKCYKAMGQTSKALAAYENYTAISDSLNNTNTQIAIEELQLSYDVEKKEQAVALLTKEKEFLTASAEVDQLKKQRLTWGLILLSLIGGLTIYSQYNLRKRNQKIAEEKQRAQQLKLENQQLEKQQLERELAAQVLQLCRKNELLTSVKQEVATIAQQDASVNKTKLQKLERSIDLDIQSDEDWEQFLSTFEKVHPDFLSRLREIAGRLTPAEQRLSCLFKMNLSSKEVATLLNISDEGVKKGRYRLRKKLGLDKEINLQEFLMEVA